MVFLWIVTVVTGIESPLPLLIDVVCKANNSAAVTAAAAAVEALGEAVEEEDVVILREDVILLPPEVVAVELAPEVD